ncbi:hypothetical protein D3C73_948530 [compost metagenome]
MTNQSREQSGQQSTAADRCHQRIDLRTVFEDFIDHCAVAFPQHRMIESRNVLGFRPLAKLLGALVGVVPDLAVDDHFGARGANFRTSGFRRGMRHHDAGLQTQARRRHRRGETGIATRGTHYFKLARRLGLAAQQAHAPQLE